jgi:uncharacterized domain HDIG
VKGTLKAWLISFVIAFGGLFYKDNLNYKKGDVVKKTIIADAEIRVKKTPERLRQDSLDIINLSPPVYRRVDFYDSLKILAESLSKIFPNSEDFRKKALAILQRGVIEPKFDGHIIIFDGRNFFEAEGGKILSLSELCRQNDTLCLYLFPTLIYDSSLTREYALSKLKNLSQYEFVLKAGDIVVSRGEIVNDTTLRILQAYKDATLKPKRISFFILGILLGIFVLVGFYLRRWVLPSSASVFVFGVVYIVEILLHYFTNISPFFTLSPIIALSVSSLDAPSLGVVLTSVLAIMRAASYDFSLSLLLYIGSMALVSSAGVKFVKNRAQTVYIAFFMIISGILSFLISLPFIGSLEMIHFKDFLYAVSLSSLISTMAYLMFLPNIEAIFHKATEYTLLELAFPNHPLLRELAEKAPGTYVHSLSVGNLAEVGARVVGANAILARVGGYYHDIGKIYNPEFFVENMVEGNNPHDNLDPINSARIIISHVKKGIELARKYNLPEEVINIIASHHGTTLLLPFYLKAKASKLPYSEEQFRYPGPKPKTVEEAIVMLADSCEAASRSAENEKEIRDIVNAVFEDKIRDGQLDFVPLSKRDLEKIKEAFIPILLTYRHTRPKYARKEGVDEG